jgi:hypothetical protein
VAAASSALMSGIVGELRQVGRHDEGPVDAEAAADAGDEEGGHTADRAQNGSDGEERHDAVRLAVAAVDREAVHPEAAEQHAEVLDVVAAAALQKTAVMESGTDLGPDGQPAKIHGPVLGLEEVALHHEVE